MAEIKFPNEFCSQRSAELSQDNMRPKSAAKYLDVSEPTLARWRQPHNQDIGPPFIRAKSGGCVIYRRKDLDAWLEQHRVGSRCKEEKPAS